MNAKKFSILTFITVFIFVVFLGGSIYYDKTILANQKAQVEKDIESKLDQWDESVKDKIEQDNQQNSDDKNENIFNDFYSLYDNALNHMNTAKGFKVEAKGGVVTANINAHLAGYEDISLKCENYIKIIRDKYGKMLFRYFQYGDTVPELEGVFENAWYHQTVRHDGSYYVYQTKIGSELNAMKKDMYERYTRTGYLNKFYNDADQLFYIINPQTVDKVVYMSKPNKHSDEYIAKIILNKKAAEIYNKEICPVANFQHCDTQSTSMILTFDKEGHFKSISVEEELHLKYHIKVAGFIDHDTDIVAKNNYKMNFKFNPNMVLDINQLGF